MPTMAHSAIGSATTETTIRKGSRITATTKSFGVLRAGFFSSLMGVS